mmetsp:Transcript_5289/g.12887  ORF Transcript_5289/g.12887 Transcript_5289/m.12887 type:complete len:273 (+) Transcript_5289:86-904(+)
MLRLGSCQAITTPQAVIGRPRVCLSLRPGLSPRSQKHICVCAANGADQSFEISRRQALSSAVLASCFAFPGLSLADSKEVGTYLPAYGENNFVLFVPDPRETPALRAATIDPKNPYRFAMPSNWKRDPVANIASGNYCQPRCAEPWTEVIFSSPEDGKCQVTISPLVRLINKPNAKLEEIGSPESLINSIGPYITGTDIEDGDVLSCSSTVENGRTYYLYELYAPYGLNPPHSLAKLTTKDDAALLFTVNATDKQWANSEKKLRSMIETFSV